MASFLRPILPARHTGGGALDVPAPFDRYRDVVRPEWIDHNGHMNMGYYVVVFDFATDEFLAWIGLDVEHRRTHAITTFCLEAHVTYHREVRAGDPLRFTTVLLAHDEKRIHYFHEMYHATEGYRAAAMAPEILARLAAIQAAHDRLPRAPQVGRVIGLRPR